MTELSPKQSTAIAVERELQRAFPRTTFKVELSDALDTIEAHWRGGPSHAAVNAAVARAGRKIGFQYTPIGETTTQRVNKHTETHHESE
jgi:hypothetical protein